MADRVVEDCPIMTTIPSVDLAVHHAPRDNRDKIALGFTKVLRLFGERADSAPRGGLF